MFKPLFLFERCNLILIEVKVCTLIFILNLFVPMLIIQSEFVAKTQYTYNTSIHINPSQAETAKNYCRIFNLSNHEAGFNMRIGLDRYEFI